jgi:hypothetical protein
MSWANPPGRPVGTDRKLKAEEIPKIVEGFAKCLVHSVACSYAEMPRKTVKRWLEQGAEDVENNVESLNAQLFSKVGKTLAEEANACLTKIKTCPANYSGLTWILERCMRKHYGAETEEYKELVVLYEKLFESYKKIAEPQNQGNLSDG